MEELFLSELENERKTKRLKQDSNEMFLFNILADEFKAVTKEQTYEGFCQLLLLERDRLIREAEASKILAPIKEILQQNTQLKSTADVLRQDLMKMAKDKQALEANVKKQAENVSIMQADHLAKVKQIMKDNIDTYHDSIMNAVQQNPPDLRDKLIAHLDQLRVLLSFVNL
jgi:hypothetical protein